VQGLRGELRAFSRARCARESGEVQHHCVQDLGFRVLRLGFGVWGSGFRVKGLGYRIQGPGFKVGG
jgi:hypothetical protein